MQDFPIKNNKILIKKDWENSKQENTHIHGL